jgi:hypothetical protein
MKIDIEGFEAYAFAHAQKLFAKLDIRRVYMEWGHTGNKMSEKEKEAVKNLVEFLVTRNYTPTDKNIALDLSHWNEWPSDIVWIRDWMDSFGKPLW